MSERSLILLGQLYKVTIQPRNSTPRIYPGEIRTHIHSKTYKQYVPSSTICKSKTEMTPNVFQRTKRKTTWIQVRREGAHLKYQHSGGWGRNANSGLGCLIPDQIGLHKLSPPPKKKTHKNNNKKVDSSYITIFVVQRNEIRYMAQNSNLLK